MGNILGGSATSSAKTPDHVPNKVSPWDGQNMKRAIDEAVATQLSDGAGIPSDNSYSNAKLLLMFTACVAGATGQFYPMPFPQSRPLLAVCVVIYFGLSAVYQYLTWFVERDCVWQSKPSATGVSVFVRSVMPKYSDKFTFIVESPWAKEQFRTEVSVGKFFTEEGVLSEGALQKYVRDRIVPAIAAAQQKKKA